MLIKNTEKEWKKRFAFFPVEINDANDIVWLGWYETRGPCYERECRLPGSSESTIRSAI